MNKYMDRAFNEAIKAYKKGDVPIGCVIVKNNKVIAKGYNNRETKHNILGHAEINAILKAEKKLKRWQLEDCELYSTLYPCELCQMVIKESRIKKVYYLLDNPNIARKNNNYIQTNDCVGIEEQYNKIMKNFFKLLRK